MLVECGLLHPLFQWDKSAAAFANRASRLPLSHPSHHTILHSHQTLRWYSSLAKSDNIRCLTSFSSSTSPLSITRSFHSLQYTYWSRQYHCKDLVSLRTHSSSPSFSPSSPLHGVAFYIKNDLQSSSAIRARLRLNRSSLLSSKLRRHMISAAASLCMTCNTPETIDHLLTCPRYDLPYSILHLSSPIPITTSLLLGEVDGLPRRFRLLVLQLTGNFLTSVAAIRGADSL